MVKVSPFRTSSKPTTYERVFSRSRTEIPHARKRSKKKGRKSHINLKRNNFFERFMADLCPFENRFMSLRKQIYVPSEKDLRPLGMRFASARERLLVGENLERWGVGLFGDIDGTDCQRLIARRPVGATTVASVSDSKTAVRRFRDFKRVPRCVVGV